jgi:hypothetical protein
MAATNVPVIELSLNGVNVTKRALVGTAGATAAGTTAGSTFAIASSNLGDYSKVALVFLTSGSSDKANLTVYASTLFTNGDDYTAAINPAVPGTTQAYNFAGPFDSARFKTTSGLKFKLACPTAGNNCSVSVFALGLPGYK